MTLAPHMFLLCSNLSRLRDKYKRGPGNVGTHSRVGASWPLYLGNPHRVSIGVLGSYLFRLSVGQSGNISVFKAGSQLAKVRF